MKIHYPDNAKFQEWNDKILPRDERKTGDEITGKGRVDYDLPVFQCSNCDFAMPAHNEPDYCAKCETSDSMSHTEDITAWELYKS